MATARSRTPRQDLVLAELVDTAARVFAERGFRKATLDDIARELGVSRAALYYYVEGKEDLLRHVISRFTESHARLVDQLRKRTDLAPAERLREAIRAAARLFGERADVMRVFLREEGEMPGAVYEEHLRFKRATDAAMRAIIAEGVAGGDFREVDPRITAFAIFGMVNWMHVWYRPDGPMSTDAIADAFAELVVSGLVPGRSAASVRSAEAIVGQLRLDVDALEREIRRLRANRHGS